MSTAPPLPSVEEQVAGFRPGDHLCCIYRNRDDQMAIVIPFIASGLKNNERCMFFTDESMADDIIGWFKHADFDIGRYMDSGQFVILSKHDAYLKDGKFEPEKMIGLLREAERMALDHGFSGLRVTGEMTWVYNEPLMVERLIEYEVILSHYFHGSRTTAICQYHEARFEPNILLDIIHTHPVVAIHGKICVNPYFIPPDEFLARMREKTVSLALYERIRDDILVKDRVEKERAMLESDVGKLLGESERSRRALLSILEDRKRAEDEKKVSEERYRTLVETMHEGLWVIDEKANTTFVNLAMANILGYTLDEMIGKSIYSFMDENSIEIAQRNLARCRMGISEKREH